MTESTKKPRRSMHEAKIRWLLENQSLLEDSYPGQWVAVNDQGLVASGASFGEAVEAAEACGAPDALVAPVKSKEYQGVHLIR